LTRLNNTGRAFRLADDFVLRRARLVVLGETRWLVYGVASFLPGIRCAYLWLFFSEPAQRLAGRVDARFAVVQRFDINAHRFANNAILGE